MRYGIALRRLPFSGKESAPQPVIVCIADSPAGIPELLRIRLVGDILQHTGDLSVFNLVEQLTAELEIIPLLVDRIRAVPDDIDSLLYVFDHVGRRKTVFARA